VDRLEVEAVREAATISFSEGEEQAIDELYVPLSPA
jgi:hypothetical protein